VATAHADANKVSGVYGGERGVHYVLVGKFGQAVERLHSQLTGGRYYHRTHTVRLRPAQPPKFLDQRDEERQRLPGPRLSSTEDVSPSQRYGDGCTLNGGRCCEPSIF
jgi:hypothetical protein